MTRVKSLDQAITDVVSSRNCSGCGACCLLDAGLEMELDAAGFNRPVRNGATDRTVSLDAIRTFEKICPGRHVKVRRFVSATSHPTMGAAISAWRGWATDPKVRFDGSSGGVLTALVGWLVESHSASEALAVASDSQEPYRTNLKVIHNSEEALAASGSRYAPASVASRPEALSSQVVVGKPCEVSALRSLTVLNSGLSDQNPLLLSFFCAGTPSAFATDQLIRDLGCKQIDEVIELRYRGRGWPGDFRVVSRDGSIATMSYDDSWGKRLGPSMQWRCKICPDGVGESSDITAADFWETDKRGYPLFKELAGVSAVVARTPRGHQTLLRAVDAGVLKLYPLDLDDLASVQPFQVRRRTMLLARLVGARLAGRKIPRYHGFRLIIPALMEPRAALRTIRATFRRVRSERHEAKA